MRVAAMTQPSRATPISALAFICLNMADALLTRLLLAHGGAEAVWWSYAFNANILVKALLALLAGC